MRRECHATSSGYTLIEVLITMLVLAVGVLGAAGLQVTALKNLQTSGSYGTAAMLANDMADRMWINRAQVLADAYNHSEAPAGTIPDCDANVCSEAQMAVYDTNEWQQLVTGYIQAGTMTPSRSHSASKPVCRAQTDHIRSGVSNSSAVARASMPVWMPKATRARPTIQISRYETRMS